MIITRILGIGLMLVALSGCGLREREVELEKKAADLSKKEQELLLKEEMLNQKEKELTEWELRTDSSFLGISLDTTGKINPELVGKWNARMVCTETNCEGSAVGDSKTDKWDISYIGNTLVARVLEDRSSARIYTGKLINDVIELVAIKDIRAQGTRMNVRLQITNTNELKGERTIVRENGCRIVYSLTLQKLP